jgi:hypothetical protein
LQSKRERAGTGAAGLWHSEIAMKLTDAELAFDVSIRPKASHTRVTVVGLPTLGQLLSLIHLLGVESSSWRAETLLVDLRGVDTEWTQEEQFRMGQEAACSLAHMRKIASLVPPERITHISERAARRSGTNVSVFGDEQAAMAWLLQDD